MRSVAIVLVLVLAGCHDDPIHPGAPDAIVPDGVPAQDANPALCSALAGTAAVLADDAGAQVTFERLDAGGVWLVGPVTGVTAAPVSLSLLVTNADPLDAWTAGCCQNHDSSCCTADGLVISTDALSAGAEVGSHAVRIQRFLDPAFVLAGTLDITSFEHPWDHAPGRIAGAIHAVGTTQSVGGTFDNAFCEALLSVTI
jgi:hypothetical protein